MTEPLYTCPYCNRSGFTHRGLRVHFCSQAPPAPGERAWSGKRFLTKAEITKIVVDSSLSTQPKP